MKLCSKCGEVKPTTEFNKYAKSRDGLRPWCKACAKAYHAMWRDANPGKRKAGQAKWAAANQEKCKASVAKYHAANRDKVNASSAKRRADNPEKNREYNAAWRAAHQDKFKAYNAKWYAANTDKVKAYAAVYRAANPEARRIIDHNRRARKRESGGKLSKGLAAKLFKLQRGKCACCGLPLGTDYHMDHIMPVALGGANEDWNIQLLRSACNRQKCAAHPVAFMQSRGFLC